MIPPADTAPLSGKRIVVTRAASQAGGLASGMRERGAEVIEFPTIEIGAPESYAALDAAIEALDTYQWIFFTSVNGVECFFERTRLLQKNTDPIRTASVVAIGPETARRLEAFGVRPCLVPRHYRAEGILEELEPKTLSGKRVLIPRAADARQVLPDTLRSWGADVNVVDAYRTRRPAADAASLGHLLHAGRIDMITFTSPSTARNFAAILSEERLANLVRATAIACIGPITAQAVVDLGLKPDVVADEYTIAGLIRAIVAHFHGGRGG